MAFYFVSGMVCFCCEDLHLRDQDINFVPAQSVELTEDHCEVRQISSAVEMF